MVDYWPLVTRPYDVQRTAFNKSRGRRRFGYWLEQGLGKTALNYADFLYYLNRDEVDCNIVVVPTYLKSGWVDEAEDHRLGVPVFVWPDVPSEKQERSPFVQVMNTESALDTVAVSREGGRYLHELIDRHKAMLSVDEAVCVANFRAQITNSVIALARKVEYVRLLSGLPTPENVMQWWALLRILGEIDGMGPFNFRMRFAKMGGYMGKKCVGFRNEEELYEIVDACGIRALKEDWLDLPPKVYRPPISFDLTGNQLAQYRSMLAEFYTEVQDGEVYADQVVHQLIKLQQISRGFIKDGDEIHELVTPAKNPALKAIKDSIYRVPGKSLIFTHHQRSTKLMFEELQKDGYECIVLRGGLTTEEIRERKAAFNRDSSVRGAVMQLSVGAKGHTLLGQSGLDRCSSTFYFENTFSRDVRSHSEDRNHRIGQDAESVDYTDLVENVPGSPTKKAIKALAAKQNFIDATINSLRTRRAA